MRNETKSDVAIYAVVGSVFIGGLFLVMEVFGPEHPAPTESLRPPECPGDPGHRSLPDTGRGS